jgi:hypothetical protein
VRPPLPLPFLCKLLLAGWIVLSQKTCTLTPSSSFTARYCSPNKAGSESTLTWFPFLPPFLSFPRPAFTFASCYIFRSPINYLPLSRPEPSFIERKASRLYHHMKRNRLPLSFRSISLSSLQSFDIEWASLWARFLHVHSLCLDFRPNRLGGEGMELVTRFALVFWL